MARELKICDSGFEVRGSGFGVQGSEFRVQGSGFRVPGSGLRVEGLRWRVWGVGVRVYADLGDMAGHRGTRLPRSQETAPPPDPTAGLCLGPWGGPRGGRRFL